MKKSLLILRIIQFAFQYFFPVIVTILAARILHPSEFSALALLLSVSVLLRPFVGFSLGRVSIAYIAKSKAINGLEESRYVSIKFLVFVFLISLIILPFIYLFINWMPNIYHEDINFNIDPILPVVYIYLIGLAEGIDGILRANRMYYTLAVPNVVFRSVGVAILLTYMSFLSMEYIFRLMISIEILVVLWSVIVFILKTKSLRRINLFSREFLSFGEFKNNEITKNAFFVTITSLSAFLYAKSGSLIIGVFHGPLEVGAYEISFQILSIPLAVMLIISSVISPIIGEYIHKKTGGIRYVKRLVDRAISVSFFINSIVAVFLVVIGVDIVSDLFPNYPSLKTVLIILVPLLFIKSVVQIISGEVGVVLGYAYLLALNTIFASVANILVVLFLSKIFGSVGAASGTLLVHAISGIVVLFIILKKLPFGISIRFHEALYSSTLGILFVFLMRLFPIDNSLIRYSIDFFVFFLGVTVAYLAYCKVKKRLVGPVSDFVNLLHLK